MRVARGESEDLVTHCDVDEAAIVRNGVWEKEEVMMERETSVVVASFFGCLMEAAPWPCALCAHVWPSAAPLSTGLPLLPTARPSFVVLDFCMNAVIVSQCMPVDTKISFGA